MPGNAEDQRGREDSLPLGAEVGPMPMDTAPGDRLRYRLGRYYCESKRPFMERSISIKKGALSVALLRNWTLGSREALLRRDVSQGCIAVQATTVPEIRQRGLTGHSGREFEQLSRKAGTLVKVNAATNMVRRRGRGEEDVPDEAVYQCRETMVATTYLENRG